MTLVAGRELERGSRASGWQEEVSWGFFKSLSRSMEVEQGFMLSVVEFLEATMDLCKPQTVTQSRLICSVK